MAIIEQTNILSVTHMITSNKLVVQSEVVIVKNGSNVLATVPKRKVFDSTEKAQFINMLGTAADKYILMAGW